MSIEPITSCPCCLSPSSTVWLRGGDISVMGCECGHRYANGMLRTDELAAQYYNEPETDLEAKGNFAKRNRFDCEYDPILKAAGVAIAGKLLDVGCNTGSLLKLFEGGGWDVEGIEISPGPAALARKAFGERISIGPANEFLPRQGRYDLITVVHVLEHFRDPVELLNLCRKSIKPDGAILVEVPNALDPLVSLWGTHYRPLCLGDHISFFTSQSLTNAAARAGLVVEVLASPLRARDLLYPNILSALDFVRSFSANSRSGSGTVNQQYRYRGTNRVKIRRLLDATADALDPALSAVRPRISRDGKGPVLVALLKNHQSTGRDGMAPAA